MELIRMENKDLTQLVREYVKVEKQLEPLKELEKQKNELKKEITKEMERRTLERFNFNGRYIQYTSSESSKSLSRLYVPYETCMPLS